MKILMLTPYLPYPPASGGQIRTLYLLKYLSQNHEIFLVALYKNAQEKQYAKHLESYCKKIYLCKRAEKPWQIGNILMSVLSLLPFLIVRNFSDEAKKIVEKLLQEEKFDVIHAETFYIMPHIPKTSVPILLVEQTIEFKVYQHFISNLPFLVRLGLSIDIMKLKYWEIHYWKKASLVATVSQSDRDTIQKIETNIDPVIIPNGAGDEMFVDKLPEKKLDSPTLLFMGNFFWLQNVEAAEFLVDSIFPKLIKTIPNLNLIIAGQNAAKKVTVKNTNSVKVIDIPPDNSEIVKKLYHQATIFVAPIFGPGGTRLKILAAMAAGLPVVSTSTGVDGLGIVEGVHAILAQTPEAFAEKITKMISTRDLYTKIQKNAFALVKDHYSWSQISKQLEIAYRNIRKISEKGKSL